MIVKILDDNQQDKQIIEAERVRWSEGGAVIDCFASLGDHQPTRVRVSHGDRIFFMNNSGQTVDSKRVILRAE